MATIVRGLTGVTTDYCSNSLIGHAWARTSHRYDGYGAVHVTDTCSKCQKQRTRFVLEKVFEDEVGQPTISNTTTFVDFSTRYPTTPSTKEEPMDPTRPVPTEQIIEGHILDMEQKQLDARRQRREMALALDALDKQISDIEGELLKATAMIDTEE